MLSINISELIWTIINFFLLYFLLKRFLFTPVCRLLDERQAKIDAGLNAEKEAQAQVEANRERIAAAERNAPYFDGANFAARIRCPVRVAVGFSDMTCPPCCVYAAYNAIPVKDKKIVHGIGMTHSCFSRFYEELGAWRQEKSAP